MRNRCVPMSVTSCSTSSTRSGRTTCSRSTSVKQGIGLVGYGQKDPLVEYKKQSFDMFQDMLDRIDTNTTKALFHLEIVSQDEQEERERLERLEQQRPAARRPAWRSPARWPEPRSPAPKPPATRRSSAINPKSNRTSRATAAQARNSKNATEQGCKK